MRKLFFLVCALLFGVASLMVGCEQSSDELSGLSVKVEIVEATSSSLSFKISSTNAGEVKYLVTKASDGMCDAEQVLKDGTPTNANPEYIIKVDDLESGTPYLVSVVATNDKDVVTTYEIASTESKYYNEKALDFSFVRRLVDDSYGYADSDFALLFTDAYPEYELTVVFTAEAGDRLPEGTYSTEGGVSANIDAKRSFLSFTNGDEPIYFDKIESRVRSVFPREDDYYHIEVDLYAGNTHYTVLVREYVGNMPKYDITNMVFDTPYIRENEDGTRATIIFHTEDDKVTLVAETYILNPLTKYLTPGEYKVAMGEGGFKPGDIDAHNSWFIANGYYGELVSGTINVAIDVSMEDNYDYIFDVDLVDELGREVKFECKGYIPSQDFYNKFSVNTATYSEVGDHYHISFHGNYLLSFDIYADEFAEGTYPIVDAAEAQTPYVDKSSLHFSALLGGEIAIRGGKVRIVRIEGDEVEFQFKLLAEDDYYIWTGVYYEVLENFKK